MKVFSRGKDTGIRTTSRGGFYVDQNVYFKRPDWIKLIESFKKLKK